MSCADGLSRLINGRMHSRSIPVHALRHSAAVPAPPGPELMEVSADLSDTTESDTRSAAQKRAPDRRSRVGEGRDGRRQAVATIIPTNSCLRRPPTPTARITANGAEGFAPRDHRQLFPLPRSTRMTGITAARLSFADSSELLQELAGLAIEPKLERQAALTRPQRQVIEPEPSEAHTLYLGLDTGVPVRRDPGQEGQTTPDKNPARATSFMPGRILRLDDDRSSSATAPGTSPEHLRHPASGRRFRLPANPLIMSLPACLYACHGKVGQGR